MGRLSRERKLIIASRLEDIGWELVKEAVYFEFVDVFFTKEEYTLQVRYMMGELHMCGQYETATKKGCLMSKDILMRLL